MGEPKAAEADGKSRLEEIKYYTSMFLGALCIVCVFAFLFLVPFVLDPAISTLMHQFVETPVHCRLESSELRYGKSNCSWASCREGCTAEIFKCHQLRVTYTPKIEFQEAEIIENIDPKAWAHLTRTEKLIDPETNQPSGEERTVKDTPLLINIKGCGYPPEVNCDIYSERYQNFSLERLTFPCHYSVMNPWIVISDYDRAETLTSIAYAILVPNLMFVLSLVVLVYWYCPYCQAKCKKYEQQTDVRENHYESDEEDYTMRDNNHN